MIENLGYLRNRIYTKEILIMIQLSKYANILLHVRR